MKFGAHFLPTYVPELDGPVTEFYRQIFEQMSRRVRRNAEPDVPLLITTCCPPDRRPALKFRNGDPDDVGRLGEVEP